MALLIWLDEKVRLNVFKNLSVSYIIEFKGLIMLFYNLRAKIYKKTDTAKFLRKK